MYAMSILASDLLTTATALSENFFPAACRRKCAPGTALPLQQLEDNRPQAGTKGDEGVLDFGWNVVVDFPVDDSVLLLVAAIVR
jgi:hypothetical protein